MPLDGATFSLEMIEIDQQGAVTFTDGDALEALQPLFEKVTPEKLLGDNGICGSNCPEK